MFVAVELRIDVHWMPVDGSVEKEVVESKTESYLFFPLFFVK